MAEIIPLEPDPDNTGGGKNYGKNQQIDGRPSRYAMRDSVEQGALRNSALWSNNQQHFGAKQT